MVIFAKMKCCIEVVRVHLVDRVHEGVRGDRAEREGTVHAGFG